MKNSECFSLTHSLFVYHPEAQKERKDAGKVYFPPLLLFKNLHVDSHSTSSNQTTTDTTTTNPCCCCCEEPKSQSPECCSSTVDNSQNAQDPSQCVKDDLTESELIELIQHFELISNSVSQQQTPATTNGISHSLILYQFQFICLNVMPIFLFCFVLFVCLFSNPRRLVQSIRKPLAFVEWNGIHRQWKERATSCSIRWEYRCCGWWVAQITKLRPNLLCFILANFTLCVFLTHCNLCHFLHRVIASFFLITNHCSKSCKVVAEM
jgi:hypothetical protein